MKTLNVIRTTLLTAALFAVSASVSADPISGLLNGTARVVGNVAHGTAHVVGAAANGAANTVGAIGRGTVGVVRGVDRSYYTHGVHRHGAYYGHRWHYRTR